MFKFILFMLIVGSLTGSLVFLLATLIEIKNSNENWLIIGSHIFCMLLLLFVFASLMKIVYKKNRTNND